MTPNIELLKKSKIDFPRELSGKEFKRFFKYISRHIKGEARHRVAVDNMAGSIFLKDHESKTKKLESRLCNVKLDGAVSVAGLSSLNFEGEIRYNAYNFYLKGIRFITSPSYIPEEHQIEQIGLMDRVREQANNYFSKQKKSKK